MASHNQITILSSSPPRQFAIINMSSPLPSPSELFKKNPASLPTGSRAASIPLGSLATFTASSALLKDTKVKAKALSITDTKEDSGMMVEEITKTAKPMAKRAPAKTTNTEPKAAKVVRKPKAAATTNDLVPVTEVGKVKKKPATKSEFFSEKGGPLPEVAAKKPRMKKVHTETAAESAAVVKKPRAKIVVKVTPEESSEALPKKSQGKCVNKETVGDLEEVPSKKARIKAAEKEVTVEPKAKAVRKSRAKKPIDISQGLFPESNVTKPAPRSKKAKETSEEPIDFGLVEAIKRKTTWTPPVPTTMEASITPASALILDKDVESAGVGTSEKMSKGFSDLFGSFGFLNGASSARSSAEDSAVATTKAQDQAVIRKRKLIELVKTDGSISPTKKAPKKKPRTITERATAAYAEDDEKLNEPTPLMQYFSLQSKDKLSTDGFKVPTKPRSKSPVKGTKQAPILLSPESAMKQVSNQDFVFGTSSQLAREDSPTLLRDLHQATQASLEQADPYESLEDYSTSPVIKKSKLWNAASRDADGELLDVEMVDLIDSVAKAESMPIEGTSDWHDIDEVIRTKEMVSSLKEPSKSIAEGISLPIEGAGDWLDIDEVTQPKGIVITRPGPIEQRALPSSPPHRLPCKAPTPKPSQTTKSSPIKVHVTVPSQKAIPQMPDYTSYPTTKLTKEIASYRFKPIKSRDGMIIMLKRCWEGKHRVALQSLDTNIPKTSPLKTSKPPASSQASPRPRGRPKKDGSAATSPVTKPKLGRPKKDSSAITSPTAKAKLGRPRKVVKALESALEHDTTAHTPRKKTKKVKEAAEEISDSDSLRTPSPPRRRLSQVVKPPSPLRLISDDTASSPERTSSQTQELLFEHITKAVTSGSPSKESNHPTWHEKILLYDPIIVEDLAIWLNTGALGTVGWDGEVAPWEVKKWCESMSICCLWKVNLRGETRNRY